MVAELDDWECLEHGSGDALCATFGSPDVGSVSLWMTVCPDGTGDDACITAVSISHVNIVDPFHVVAKVPFARESVSWIGSVAG